MKTAAAFAAIVAVAVYITTDEIQATPSLRSLRSTTENQPLHEDESSKGHHHRHIKKVVKKVTKIAIPVPVGVPQYIPVPINVPSPVVASSNTAVVSSSNNAVIGTSTAAVGAGGPSSGLVTPAPTTLNGQTAVTPAPTTPASTIPASMIPASATPAPTNLANANTGNGQLSAIPVPGTQNGDLRATEMPTFSNVGGNNNVVGGGLNIGARNTLPVNSGGIARGFGNGNPINGFSAANQMGAFGSEMSTNRGANMNGRLNRNEVGGFGHVGIASLIHIGKVFQINKNWLKWVRRGERRSTNLVRVQVHDGKVEDKVIWCLGFTRASLPQSYVPLHVYILGLR